MCLIVIEGLDGSGKGTQASLLCENLTKVDSELRRITFPDYDSNSSALVKMYLAGEFGNDADSVNAYAASTFYAVDRFASFSTKWGKSYREGHIIVADRYTTSNLTYQLSKLPENEWDEFAQWLYDLEFVKMGLPVPDSVIYLDMDPEISQKLLSHRYSGDEAKKDIHEKNIDYLKRCRCAAFYAAEKFNWTVIRCDDGDKPRKVEEIQAGILSSVSKIVEHQKND